MKKSQHIIIYDIDYYLITNFLPINSIINVMCINKSFLNLVCKTRLYKELNILHKISIDTTNDKHLCIIEQCIKLQLHSIFLKIINDEHFEFAFMQASIYGNLEVIKILHHKSIFNHYSHLHMNNDFAFKFACINGHLDVIKWLYRKCAQINYPIDIHVHDGCEFDLACQNGHFKTAKWLYKMGIKLDKPFDIQADNNYAFRMACRNGHLEIAKWLYSKCPHIDICVMSFAITRACEQKHLKVIKWLYKINTQCDLKYLRYLLSYTLSSHNKNSEINEWFYKTCVV